MHDIVIPKTRPDFDKEPLVGTVAALLDANVGKTVKVEYESIPPLVQSGSVYAVGTDWLLLWDASHKTYSTGDLRKLRSVVFYPETR